MIRRLMALVILTALIAGVCITPAKAAGGKIQIVATVGMVADIARQVGGDRVDVTGLMGPGVDPHTYRATLRDVDALARAQIVFYGGLHLEGKMADLFHQLNDQIPSVGVGDTLPVDQLLGFAQQPEYHDPHVWFDVSFWSLATERVRDTLKTYDPDYAASYDQHAATYLARLTALDDYTKSAILTIPAGQRLMITSHDAFRYYGRRYGLEVTAIQGISTEAEAGAQDVIRLASLIASRKIPSVFVESSVSPRMIQAVQAAAMSRGQDVQIGGELFSDALGNAGTLEGTYIGMILHNDLTIVRALGGNPPALPSLLSDYQPLYDHFMAV